MLKNENKLPENYSHATDYEYQLHHIKLLKKSSKTVTERTVNKENKALVN